MNTSGNTLLKGRRLLVARATWLVLVILNLIAFIVELPQKFALNQHPSSANAALTPQAIVALNHAGISLTTYAWLTIIMACAVTLVAVIMAGILFWRRGNDWMALLVALFLVIYITGNVGALTNAPSSSPSGIGDILYAIFLGQRNVPSAAIPFAVFLLFPNGKFVPRWSRWLFVISLIVAFAIGATPTLFGGLLFLSFPLLVPIMIICIVYRYRRASTPAQRLQVKWIIVGFIATLIANQVFWIPTGFTPLGQTIYPPLAFLAYQITLLAAPITFFVAIQRYRLYEIDILINRALVYGSLTVSLVAIYATCVIGTQALIVAFTGAAAGQAPILIVATTLLIAALFRPLRARLQAAVDRRFYRTKYDAAKTVDAFSELLRQDVDMADVQGHLVEAVKETMQPAHVSLWLLAPSNQLSDGAKERESRISM